jgi:hypothetical protein
MLNQEQPDLPAYDPDRLAIESNYASMDLAVALERFLKSRADHVSQLRAITDADWMHTGLHEEVGEISIQQLTAHMVVHDLVHMAQLARGIGR